MIQTLNEVYNNKERAEFMFSVYVKLLEVSYARKMDLGALLTELYAMDKELLKEEVKVEEVKK